MDNFVITIKDYPRLGQIVPPLVAVGYSAENPPKTKLQMRTTVNFGMILSAPFEEARYEMDNKIYKARIPTFSCIQPGWVCRQSNPGTCEKLYFVYDASQMGRFSYFENRLESIMMPMSINSHMSRIIGEIRQMCSNYEYHGNIDRLDMLCAQLVTEFIIEENKKTDTVDSITEHIAEIASFIDTHFEDSVNLAELIRQAGISERTFSRRWKKQFGISPYAYILNRKINKSCQMLQETNLPVYEIAAAVGFTDQYYFSRIFKKYISYSPLEYRNLH